MDNIKQAIECVTSYLDRREKARGLDFEAIHGFDGTFELKASDLKTLLAAISQQESGEKPVAIRWLNGRGKYAFAGMDDTVPLYVIGIAEKLYTRPATQHSAPTELPPLPEPDATTDVNGKVAVRYFSDLKVVEYARAALSASQIAAKAADPEELAATDAEFARIKHERDTLVKGIADAALKAGIWNGEVALTGPHLLMFCNDMAECIAASQVAAPEGVEPSEQDKGDAERFIFEHTQPDAMLKIEIAALNDTSSANNIEWWRTQIDAAIASLTEQGKTS